MLSPTKNLVSGTVTAWTRRHFGFIAVDGNPDELFLHLTDCPNREPLTVNTRVRFQIVTYGARLKAANVEVIQ